MSLQVLRKTAYLMIGTLLLLISAAFIANFNTQTVQAAPVQGTSQGGVGELYFRDLIRGQLALDNPFTIHTLTKLGDVNTYVVKRTLTAAYYVAKVGDDYICLIKTGDRTQNIICLPYSTITSVTYRN